MFQWRWLHNLTEGIWMSLCYRIFHRRCVGWSPPGWGWIKPFFEGKNPIFNGNNGLVLLGKLKPENPMIFNGKINGFRLRFSLNPIQWMEQQSWIDPIWFDVCSMNNDDFTSMFININTFDFFLIHVKTWTQFWPSAARDLDLIQVWSKGLFDVSLPVAWRKGKILVSMIYVGIWFMGNIWKHAKLRVPCWFINVSCFFFLMGRWNENRRSQTPGLISLLSYVESRNYGWVRGHNMIHVYLYVYTYII